MPRFLLLLTLFAFGCVPKARYEEALADQARLYDRIDGMQEAMGDMSREIAHLESERKTCTAALVDCNGRLATKIAEAGELQRDIDIMRDALIEHEERRAHADEALGAYSELVTQFEALGEYGIRVKLFEGMLAISIPADGLFANGQTRLSKTGLKLCKQVAAVLLGLPERVYQVAAHTDNASHPALLPTR